jgi:hypothetical protein
MSSWHIGRIVGAVLITGGLLVGLLGCARVHDLLIGPVEEVPVTILEAIPIDVSVGEPVRFFVSARAAEGRKIEAVFVSFGDETQFKSGPMAVTSIDRQEIVHFYTLPDGVDVMTMQAALRVYDDAGNRRHDTVWIRVWRGED